MYRRGRKNEDGPENENVHSFSLSFFFYLGSSGERAGFYVPSLSSLFVSVEIKEVGRGTHMSRLGQISGMRLPGLFDTTLITNVK